MYEAPYIRCQVTLMMFFQRDSLLSQIYLIGLLVGWFLQYKKTLKINPVYFLFRFLKFLESSPSTSSRTLSQLVNLLLWALSFALMFTVILGMHNFDNGVPIDRFWR